MTDKSNFSDEEWELVREGPPTAGLVAAAASSGGSFSESWALAKAFTEARKQHGESALLDALVSERPHAKRYGSREALEEQGIQRLRDAVTLLEQKATPAEVDDYRKFTLTLAEHVAAAHKEGGAEVSTEEREALDKISAAVSSSQS